jgi:hypothetical protein
LDVGQWMFLLCHCVARQGISSSAAYSPGRSDRQCRQRQCCCWVWYNGAMSVSTHHHEPAHDLPIASTADVIVVGGGPAGIAAALAAARTGASTILVERFGYLGGTATASLSARVQSFIITAIAGISSMRAMTSPTVALCHRRLRTCLSPAAASQANSNPTNPIARWCRSWQSVRLQAQPRRCVRATTSIHAGWTSQCCARRCGHRVPS